jgi:hypothetical protein
VYSDKDLGKIHSIDGYQLTSGQKKVNQCNIYSAFPVKEVRSDVMNSALKTDLKAWLRKYSTPQQQRNHPFEQFERPVPAFEILKNELKDFLTDFGISMHTKTNPDGNLSVSHYMTLLQKLTATLNCDIITFYFRLPDNYDFNLDDQHTKRSGSQKGYKEWLLQEAGGDTRVHQIVINEACRMVNKDIPDIFAYINSTTGTYKPIEYELVDSQQKHHQVFQIEDADVQKQEKLKAIRDANKAQRANLTKQQIADKVWKYRYIPPKLDLFERNVTNDDVIKFRPLTRMAPYKRNVFNQRPSEEYILPDYVSPYSKKIKSNS